jgi:hypothetical protein
MRRLKELPMVGDFGRDPLLAGAEAAAERLNRADITFDAREYMDSDPVVESLHRIESRIEWREPDATYRVTTELAAEMVAFGEILRAAKGEPPMSDELIDDIRRVWGEIIDDIFER